MHRKGHSETEQESQGPGRTHKTARTHVCAYVRMRLLFSVVTFEAPVCCAARPDTSSALATMSPKLVKKSGLKASSATSSQSSPQKSTSRVDLRTLTASKKALGSPGRRNAKPASAPINLYVWQYNSDCHAWLTAPCASSKLYALMLEHEGFPVGRRQYRRRPQCVLAALARFCGAN